MSITWLELLGINDWKSSLMVSWQKPSSGVGSWDAGGMTSLTRKVEGGIRTVSLHF